MYNRVTTVSSVQFSCSVMSDVLRPHESQHARPPCLSPTPGVYPNSCPSSQWCHPAISSCLPLLLLPPIPPSIRVFSNESALLMSWPEYWSFSFSIIPSKEHPGLISFRMDWLDLWECEMVQLLWRMVWQFFKKLIEVQNDPEIPSAPRYITTWSEVTQSCPTLCDPIDCSPPGSSVHGILQARILEWVSISFSRYITTYVHIKTYTENFIAALFIATKKVETTQIFINCWLDKQNLVYLCNEILFSHRKEWSTDTCYSMDES